MIVGLARKLPGVINLLDKQAADLRHADFMSRKTLNEKQDEIMFLGDNIISLKEELKKAKKTNEEIDALKKANIALKEDLAKVQNMAKQRKERLANLKGGRDARVQKLVNERDEYRAEMLTLDEQVRALKAQLKESNENSAWGWVRGLFSGGTSQEAPSNKRRRT